ncbi:MAG: hypothetical protein IKV57_05400 [Clostridia bacterium]|nr:hypothetical protein [Clostridia bacterium]
MNASNGNMAEYTVERKATGKYLKYKIACLALYAAIVLGYLCTTVALSTYGVWVAIVIIPFVPLFIMLLRHYVWNRYVNVEYKYEIVSAYIHFYEVYGKQRQNKIYERLISEFTLIAPMTDEFKDKYENAEIVRDFRGRPDTPDAYFMLAAEEDGKTSVVFFEAAEKTLKALKYYNSQNLVATRPTTW